MRKLTISRGKTFVGCAGKLKIYIEDPTGDLEIKGVLCKKLGELKNGQTNSFEIENSALRVFAIFDKLSINYCYDCYQLSEGDEDVNLSGRCKLNPAAGNAFRFDGNDSPETTAERKKSVKRGLIVLLVSLVIGSIVGFSATTAILEITNSKEKTFSVGDMQITLNEGFTQQVSPGSLAAFGSKRVAVFVGKANIESSNITMTAAQYARALIGMNSLSCEVEKDGDLPYFTATITGSNGKKYVHYTYVYKTEDAFWAVEFAVRENHAARQEKNISQWAHSVIFN